MTNQKSIDESRAILKNQIELLSIYHAEIAMTAANTNTRLIMNPSDLGLRSARRLLEYLVSDLDEQANRCLRVKEEIKQVIRKLS